jgi:hypothetical protein
VRQTERGIQRGALDVAESVGTVPHGPEQLMQACERQMCLRLHTRGAEHAHASITCRLLRLGQQTRFADSGLAAEHQGVTVRRNVFQQRRQEAQFLDTAD